jgi:hypothetical protein
MGFISGNALFGNVWLSTILSLFIRSHGFNNSVGIQKKSKEEDQRVRFSHSKASDTIIPIVAPKPIGFHLYPKNIHLHKHTFMNLTKKQNPTSPAEKVGFQTARDMAPSLDRNMVY